MLKDNNKLTRFYTGLPTYDIFLGLVDYLKPIVKVMRSWKGNSTNMEEKQHGLQCFSNLSVANQLFSVFIGLWLGLLITDVSTKFKIPEATYSCILLSKELHQMFPFPSREQVSQWMPKRFKKHFPNTTVIIDCYKIECLWPSGLVSSSITYSHYKSRNTWKILIGCTPSGLVSFVSKAWGGWISDQEITEKSGLLDLLQPGDMIRADSGFYIQETVASKGISVNIPPFLGSKQKQMSAHDVEKWEESLTFEYIWRESLGEGIGIRYWIKSFPIQCTV